MNYAIIENEVVINVIVCGDGYEPNDNEVAISEGVSVSIGDSYINGEFKIKETEIKVDEYVPQVLSRFQAVRVLKSFEINGSTLYKLTDDFIKTLDTSIVENDEIVDAWNMAAEFRRTSPTILMAQKSFKLTDDQVDEMFINGARIKA